MPSLLFYFQDQVNKVKTEKSFSTSWEKLDFEIAEEEIKDEMMSLILKSFIFFVAFVSNEKRKRLAGNWQSKKVWLKQQKRFRKNTSLLKKRVERKLILSLLECLKSKIECKFS